jgi:hypothetical protein
MTDDLPRYTLREPEPDPWQKLPSLAARLGVTPCSGPMQDRVIVRTRDGTSYDIFELLFAFLDHLDRAVRD